MSVIVSNIKKELREFANIDVKKPDKLEIIIPFYEYKKNTQ